MPSERMLLLLKRLSDLADDLDAEGQSPTAKRLRDTVSAALGAPATGPAPERPTSLVAGSVALLHCNTMGVARGYSGSDCDVRDRLRRDLLLDPKQNIVIYGGRDNSFDFGVEGSPQNTYEMLRHHLGQGAK